MNFFNCFQLSIFNVLLAITLLTSANSFEFAIRKDDKTLCFLGDIKATMTHTSPYNNFTFEINDDTIWYDENGNSSYCSELMIELNFTVAHNSSFKFKKKATEVPPEPFMLVRMRWFKASPEEIQLRTFAVIVFNEKFKDPFYLDSPMTDQGSLGIVTEIRIESFNNYPVEKLSFSCEKRYDFIMENYTEGDEETNDYANATAIMTIHSIQWQAFANIDTHNRHFGPVVKCKKEIGAIEKENKNAFVYGISFFAVFVVVVVLIASTGRLKFRQKDDWNNRF